MRHKTHDKPQREKCPTDFVPDLPSESDSFATNKAYKRIVSAIVDIVFSKNNDGMSIGVEGSWGAGKTTIINLLRDELRDFTLSDQGERQVHLVAFDAWAHEGDPLRLTFLETLKDCLVTEGWVKKDKWDEQLDIISGRKDITNTANDYGLGWFDYVIAFSFFLIPVGVAVLQAALRNEITLDRSQPVAWKLLFGLFLCVAAPLLVLGRLRWQLFKAKRISSRADAGEVTADPQTSKQWFLALLLNRTLSAGRTVVVKTPEPTSYEFEKQFKNLMSDALDKNPERRIVLVIDNLDRVQRPQAMAIWSTLQTFLQHRYHNPPEWLKQLYTIVLYDPNRISEHPSKSDDNADNASENMARPIEPTQPAKGQADGSFLDKSFQIRFEVPPPNLSDWRSYLLDLLNKALPRHASEYHDVYRVLAVERHKDPPTIRDLKVYVNQISAIHLQWEDAFPLSHVAYYVRLKRRQVKILSGLVKGTYPEQAYKDILGDGARDTLAALSFNVEPAIAYQILLGNPIQEALADSSGNNLQKLAARFKNGFWEALESTVASDWAGGQGERIGIAVVSVDHSGVLNDTSRAEAGSVRNTFSRMALACTAWKPFNPTIAEGVSIICQWSSLTGSSGNLVNRITQLYEAITEGLFERDSMRRSVINVPEWLYALDLLVQRNRSLTLPEVDHVHIIVTKIQDRLKSRDYLQAEEISRLLEVLVELNSYEPIATDALRELAGGGQILYYFNYVHNSSRAHDSCAWCILTFLCFAPSVEAPPDVAVHEYNALLEVSKKENVEDVQEFSKLLVNYKHTLTPIVLERGNVLKNFLSECLKHIVSGPLAKSFFTVPVVLKNWRVFSSKIREWKKDVPGFNGIVADLANNSALTDEIQRIGFKKEESSLYRLLIEDGKSDVAAFRNWCREELQHLTTAEWESDMQGSRELVDLVLALQKVGTELNLGEPYQIAIVTTVENALNDTDSPFVLPVDMTFLLTPLKDTKRHDVCVKVYEQVQHAKGEFPQGFFSSYGEFISEVLRVDQESVSSILRPIIENRDEAEIKWLARVFREHSSLLKKPSDPQAVDDFKTIVKRALDKPGNVIIPLTELARAIRVDGII